MRILFLIIFSDWSGTSFSQQISIQLDKAITALQQDKQFEHALIGFSVIDLKTGKPVYEKNAQTGMAPASCQKIITSVSAFELLGKDYKYETQFGYSGTIADSSLNGNIYISGNGDPTFGSWRWKETSEDFIVKKIIAQLKKLDIFFVQNLIIDNTKWGTQTIPDGWVWQDIGNYYGAGSGAFNWHENQYDIKLKPGKKIGDSVTVLSLNPAGIIKTVNELTTAANATGDQAYVYSSPYSFVNFLRGTVPVDMDSLTIAAACTDAGTLFGEKIFSSLYKEKIFIANIRNNLSDYFRPDYLPPVPAGIKMEKSICNFISPSFDSINYWFLKKSINLYGEAFVKTIAYEKAKTGSTDTGINIIKNFWSSRGIEKSSLKILDGSGLSPSNRITTDALVKVLEYAKERPWYASFFNALPEMNGIKMKDGYIGGVRSYAGYIKSATGAEYCFAFIVNNFDGSSSTAKEKIWKVLNLLK